MPATDAMEITAKLSPRQKDCLRLVYRLKTSKEIAAELGLSPGTVHTYCAEAVATLGARNRRHAAEILHFAEHGGGEEAPRQVQLEPAGVKPGGVDLPPAAQGISPSPWWRLLPIRPSGAANNDLSILLRLAWIPILAGFFAISFGMLAVCFEVVANLFRGGR